MVVVGGVVCKCLGNYLVINRIDRHLFETKRDKLNG